VATGFAALYAAAAKLVLGGVEGLTDRRAERRAEHLAARPKVAAPRRKAAGPRRPPAK
jgi:hypothetical protein